MMRYRENWLRIGARVWVKQYISQVIPNFTFGGFAVTVIDTDVRPDGIYAKCADDSGDYRWAHANELEPLED